MSIRVVYHVHARDDGSWEPVVREQAHGLLLSGLYAACDAVHCFVSGDPAAARAAAAFVASRGAKVCVACVPGDASHERLALHGLRGLVTPGDRVLYLHSKGVTKPGDERVADWRRMMEHFLVGGWRRCVELLDGQDLVGCNWRAEPRPHFSGNFWWARADHLLRLPESVGPEYCDPEFYVAAPPPGHAPPGVVCLHESGVDHYKTSYPPIVYE